MHARRQAESSATSIDNHAPFAGASATPQKRNPPAQQHTQASYYIGLAHLLVADAQIEFCTSENIDCIPTFLVLKQLNASVQQRVSRVKMGFERQVRAEDMPAMLCRDV
jgi:hypothetical protein